MLRQLGAVVVVSTLSSVAWAQSAPKPPPLDCTLLTQPGTPCARSGARAASIRVARIGVELVLATLLGAAVGAGGAYAGLNVDLASGHETGAGFALGTSFGVALGVAPGVWLGGAIMGGDGSFGWTLLGAAGGTAISAAILSFDSKPGTLFLGATFPLSAAILAYELSAHTRKHPKATTSMLVPSVGPTSVGVMGTF